MFIPIDMFPLTDDMTRVLIPRGILEPGVETHDPTVLEADSGDRAGGPTSNSCAIRGRSGSNDTLETKHEPQELQF